MERLQNVFILLRYCTALIPAVWSVTLARVRANTVCILLSALRRDVEWASVLGSEPQYSKLIVSSNPL